MSSFRKNTLVVDFSVLPKRVPTDQVEEFLRDIVKLDMADVRNIQLHTLQNCLYIELRNAGLPARLAKLHHLRYSFEHNGVAYRIPIYVDGPTTTIRIHDLPPQMANTTISKYLQQYGNVISISNEVWKHYFSGMPNGVRLVRMRMEKPVPTYITIDNQSSFVTYPKGEKPKITSNEKEDDDKQQKRSSAATTTKQATPDNQQDQQQEVNVDDDDADDDDDDGNDGSDSTANNDLQTTTKRRLSTRTSSDENDTEREHSQGQVTEVEKERIEPDTSDAG